MKKTLLLTMIAMLYSCNSTQNSDQLSESEIEAVLNPSVEKRVERLYFNISLMKYKNYPYPEARLSDINQYAYDLRKLSEGLENEKLKNKILITSDSLEREAELLDSKIDYTSDVKSVQSTYRPTDEDIDDLFSKWDGSLPSLKDAVKQNMHDDSSFEHVETSWKILSDGLHVRMKYRGNNAYGNKVLNIIEVKTNFSGNILSIISE